MSIAPLILVVEEVLRSWVERVGEVGELRAELLERHGIVLAGPRGGLQAPGRVMVHLRVGTLAITRTIALACLHSGHCPLHHGYGVRVVSHVLRIGCCALL